MSDQQQISKDRVKAHGEVYTPSREVNDMLDMVAQEVTRIDARFLEPACGRGNFLVEILRRKLTAVASRYRNSQVDFERNAVLAVSSIYGIDILPDNVEACRQRLLALFDAAYSTLFRDNASSECRAAVAYILARNIVWGDALTLARVDGENDPIVFSEWSPLNGSLLKRRDYSFRALVHHERNKELPLFSDVGEDVFIPTPVKDYPLVHYLKIIDAE